MFTPIKAPPNQHLGPATGDGTEFGDNWTTAVSKINDGFAKVLAAVEGRAAPALAHVEGAAHDAVHVVDADARKAFAALKDAHDGVLERVKTVEDMVDQGFSEMRGQLQDLRDKLEALLNQPPVEPPPQESGVKVEAADPEAGLNAVANALNLSGAGNAP